MLVKITLCSIIFSVFSLTALAQTAGDYNKFEVYGGYSNNQVENGRIRVSSSGNFAQVRDGYNGFEISGAGNFKRYIGVKGDFSAAFRNRNGATSSVYNFLGGLQFKDNRKEGTVFRPFGHVLAGVATQKFGVDSSFLTSAACTQPGITCGRFNITQSGFAAAIGGGIDIKASKRLSIRAIQIDYNPIHPDSNTQDNFRFGIGLVFH